MSQPLINKYRPATFEEVVGHEGDMEALRRTIASDTRPHAYLFTGPAGIGKTTTARLVARAFQADVTEIDAASNNGIDAVRELISLGQHMSLLGAGNRAFIIDECHRLTANAWDALLKLLEEPPEHLYLMLCTTEPRKVPETIKSRCYHTGLKPLKPDEIYLLLEVIAEAEGWQVLPEVMQAVVQAATGQPRKAISFLQRVHAEPSREEAKRVLALVDESEPLLEIGRMLVSGKTNWKGYQEQLRKLNDDDFEGAPEALGGYITAVMVNADSEAKAQKAWRLLDALLFPAAGFNRKASFYAALGRMIFQS